MIRRKSPSRDILLEEFRRRESMNASNVHRLQPINVFGGHYYEPMFFPIHIVQLEFLPFAWARYFLDPHWCDCPRFRNLCISLMKGWQAEQTGPLKSPPGFDCFFCSQLIWFLSPSNHVISICFPPLRPSEALL